MTHPLLTFLAKLPQFQPRLTDGCVIEMRFGTAVSKFDGGDEPKHYNTLSLRWPGQESDVYCIVEGARYAALQIKEAIALGCDGKAMLEELDKVLAG